MQQSPSEKVHIVHVVSVDATLGFFRGAYRYLQEHGFQVTAVSSCSERLAAFSASEGCLCYGVDIKRSISPVSDLVAIFRLARLFVAERPAIVHGHTPKGGLLSMIAAAIAGVPVRIYHIHGFPFATAHGAMRGVLKVVEAVTCAFATDVFAVSRGMREIADHEGVRSRHQISVLLNGSITGIDVNETFSPSPEITRRAQLLRLRLGIDPAARVIGFVGRIVRDKGVVVLADAWSKLKSDCPSAILVLVGARESRDAVPASVLDRLISDPAVRVVGAVENLAEWYAMFDVVVLPTFREGLPYVPLEAAAMKVPVVATRIPGCVEAVRPGYSGTLVAPGNPEELRNALRIYLADERMRREHGQNGREFVTSMFSRDKVWAALIEMYNGLARARGASTSVQQI